MSEPIAEKLLKVRKDLEDLTSKYILEILESKESAHSHANKLMTILNSIGEGVLVFDTNLKLVLANQAASNIVGSAIPEMTRDEMRKSFRAYRKNTLKQVLAGEEPLVIAMKEKRVVTEELLVKGDLFPPEGLWVQITAAPVINEDGEILGGVSVFQNIHERTILQRQRDAVVSLLTHDFKNHFAAEYTVVELLKRDFLEKANDSERELLLELQKSSQHYADLGITLLEIFRADVAEQAKLKVDINLQEVLSAAMQLNSLNSARQKVSLDLVVPDGLPVMKGIVSAWRQVFHNLIQNGIEASSEGQTVTIKAEDNSQGGVRVIIEDNGIGMSQEQCDKIFDANKTEMLRKSAYSSGFGLYLCRFLIEAQGGLISCTSKEGQGTKFVVEMQEQ